MLQRIGLGDDQYVSFFHNFIESIKRRRVIPDTAYNCKRNKSAEEALASLLELPGNSTTNKQMGKEKGKYQI